MKRESNRFSLILMFFLVVMALGLNGCKKELTPVHTQCCCGTSTGIMSWSKDGYFCANTDSVFNCNTQIEEYPSNKSCPLQYQGFKSLDKNNSLVSKEKNNFEFKSFKRNKSQFLNCTKECANNSSYCLKAELNDTVLSKPTQNLINKINDIQEGTILKSEIMGFYDIIIDPCNRGDLNKQGSTLSNAGTQCYFGKTFNLIGTVKIGVVLPKNLLLSIESIDSVSGVFASKTESTKARLEFDDKYLQMDFGGTIEKFKYTKGTILVQTNNGCVQMIGDSQ